MKFELKSRNKKLENQEKIEKLQRNYGTKPEKKSLNQLLVHEMPRITLKIGQTKIKALIDSGASYSFINQKIVEKENFFTWDENSSKITFVNDSLQNCDEIVKLQLQIKTPVKINAHVADINGDFIIGMDITNKLRINFDVLKGNVLIQGVRYKMKEDFVQVKVILNTPKEKSIFETKE